MENTLSLENARELGFNKFYFTWMGLGDTLGLLFAANAYYAIHKQKILLCIYDMNLAKNIHWCYFIKGLNLAKMFSKTARRSIIEQLSLFDIQPIFITASEFREASAYPGKYLMKWPAQHIFSRYCERIGVTGIFKYTPPIILTEDEKKYGRFHENNQIAIMSNGLQKYKTWPIHKTADLINRLRKTFNFIQIGTKKDVLLDNVKSCISEKSIRHTAAILSNSDLFIGGIGGLMHLARTVSCRSVITYSSAESLIYDSYSCNENICASNACSLCAWNFMDPQHERCPNNYSCISDIRVEDVIEAIYRQMENKRHEIESEIVSVRGDNADGLADLYKADAVLWFEDTKFKKQSGHAIVAKDKYRYLGFLTVEDIYTAH